MRRIIFFRKIKRVICGCRLKGGVFFTCIFCVLFSGLLSRFLCRSPYFTLRLLGLAQVTPRPFVMCLAWTFWYMVLGSCLGAVLSCDVRGKQVCVYKGSMYLIVSLVFNVVWYPLFFEANAFFLAFWNCLVILFFTTLAALEYLKVYFSVGICMFMHALWLVYCTVLNGVALFL